ncbi:CLUMA_CG011585, isoform A [Clunio marinus]|uniref:CLUMA_CG011585, isoform A n=1 Tax=Clunio marinus TaxID=568069 RepID=A0A1J1IGQ4_9DIPT|nr:CLUMA_CG011585, isoform A [Clunio marinus]
MGDKKIDELIKSINVMRSQMDSFGKQQKDFGKQIADLKTELSKTVQLKYDSCVRKINRVEKKVDNALMNERKVTKVIVNGVPFKSKENLAQIFSSLSSKLGYTVTPDARIYRFKGENINRSIVIEFPNEFYKEEFFNRHLKVAKDLKLSLLPGFEGSDDRIYIQHDITALQYRVNKCAMDFLKAGVVVKVRIIHGAVGIKFKSDENFSFFTTPDELAAEAKKLKDVQPVLLD